MERKKTYVHTYAMLLMGEKGLSQTALAAKAGCSVPFVNYILLGKRVSAPVQNVISVTLGYRDWDDFTNAALHFSDLFASMYNYPSSDKEVLHVG